MKVNIRDVAKRYSSEVNQSSLIRCLNPDHNDSTPSMKIYDDTNTLYCFGCGFSANPISLVAKMEKTTPFQAMLLLKNWYNIEEDLSQLTLSEKSRVDIKNKKFKDTFTFYMKKLQCKKLPLKDIQELEEIFQMKDLELLNQFYHRKKNELF